MKIAVITARFSFTGVPLAQMRLAEALRRRGAEVDEIFGFIGRDNLAIQSGQGRFDLGASRVIYMLPALVRYLRRSRPDVIFSAEDHLNAIVLIAALLAGSRARVCCSSRVTPFDTYGRGGFLKRLGFKILMSALMKRAGLLTCVSQDMVLQYRQIFGNKGHVCVYNIVDPGLAAKQIGADVSHSWCHEPARKLIVAAGSLERWKGFADLIRAMTVVRKDAKLLILGEGSQRQELEALIESLGLSGRVQLIGRVDNPLAYFAKAQVFALSSLVEGMPNVLVEAMMCGCTPVATNCATGPRELLEGGEYGQLVAVGDWASLGKAINRALEKPAPASWLQKVIAPFTEQAVLGRYEELLGVREWRAVSGEGAGQ